MDGQTPDNGSPVTRRRFLRRSLQAAAGLAGLAGATTGYGFWEASHIRVRRQDVAIRNLPEPFAGTTIAVLADLHLGPFVGLKFIEEAVRLASELRPDLFALVGDFAHKGEQAPDALPRCLGALARLEAPLGVFAVPGNHDMPRRGQLY